MSACFHFPGVQCDNCRTGPQQQLFSAPTYEPPLWTGSGFDQISEKLREDEGVQLHVSKHGDKATGLFIGEPYAWEEPWPEPGRRERLRIAMNFWSTGEDAMRVIVLGTRDFRELLRLRDRYDLHKWIFILFRDRDEGTEGSQLFFQLDRELEEKRRLSHDQWAVQCHDLQALFSTRQRHHGIGAVPPVGGER